MQLAKHIRRDHLVRRRLLQNLSAGKLSCHFRDKRQPEAHFQSVHLFQQGQPLRISAIPPALCRLQNKGPEVRCRSISPLNRYLPYLLVASTRFLAVSSNLYRKSRTVLQRVLQSNGWQAVQLHAMCMHNRTSRQSSICQ
jgi:hypothetical protein